MLSRRGQYIIEYAILIAIVTAACSGMVIYLRRAVQGQTKLVGDELSEAGEGWNRARGYAQGTEAYYPETTDALVLAEERGINVRNAED